MAANNMYRVGDYVFFETSSTSPYQIRRIEELLKTPNGNVEAKVMCYYRRREISSSLISLADKHQTMLEEDCEARQKEDLTEKQRHQLKHRELFLSRQVETLPATHIRGKCTVTLLNETEALMSYLNRDDAFFYSLVYDPHQKTLLADKGEIRVGTKYQSDIVALLKNGEEDGRRQQHLEDIVWMPDNDLTEQQVDQFTLTTRAMGTFARSLDSTSTIRQPSLHMSAASASRDITLFYAMDALHKNNYDLSKALVSLVPATGPVLCRDQMEEWSASEANLFEEALEKYGKDFNDIRTDFLPWKMMKAMVEYYYMWKTTDRYVQQKRIKATESESKLKQVYIPNYNKPNPALITGKLNGGDIMPGRPCESCYTVQSTQWYSWGPVHMQCRLCSNCWSYWKKYGGLKMPTRLDLSSSAAQEADRSSDRALPAAAAPSSILTGAAAQKSVAAAVPVPVVSPSFAGSSSSKMHKCSIAGCSKEFRQKAHLARHLASAHSVNVMTNSPRPVTKTRAAFCLVTSAVTRLARQVCADILHIRRAARQPLTPVNIGLIRQECQTRMPAMMQQLKPLLKRKNRPISNVANRLVKDIADTRQRLDFYLLGPGQGSLAAPAGKSQGTDMEHSSGSKKRAADDSATAGGEAMPPAKRAAPSKPSATVAPVVATTPADSHAAANNTPATSAAAASAKKSTNWFEGEDVFFIATDQTKKLRRKLTAHAYRRVARKPNKTVKQD